MLQSILAAGTFPIWIAIYKRGFCFPCDELHSSVGIPHISNFWVSLTTLSTSSPLLQYF